MLSQMEFEDLIHLRTSEADALALLGRLTPEQVDGETFGRYVEALAKTVVTLPELQSDVMDCCGTGGSGVSHFNTSTTAAFVLAAGDVPVVKFGNRAITSLSGSFDFLEHLGIPAEVPLTRVPYILERSGLVFLFAPQCYPALRPFNTLRRQLGFRTIFNYMGPLLNPVRPAYRLIGVSSAAMQPIVAQVLSRQDNLKQAWVVRGQETLDEIACHGMTHLYKIDADKVSESMLEADFAGNRPIESTMLSVEDNIALFKAMIAGEDVSSYFHRMVCLNAGAGFLIAGKASSLEEGAAYAADLLRNGRVAETVETCRGAYADCIG